MANEYEREIGWDEPIENENPDFILLPEGDCDFEVVGFERGRHGGSDKLPACNKATLSIKLTNHNGLSTTVKHNLFLHSRTEGMVCAFFTAIGHRKKGERFTPNWNIVVGARGRCKIGIHEFTSQKSGEKLQSNDIKRFYEPKECAPAQSKGFEPGRF